MKKITKFSELSISETTLRSLQEMGYETPSPIQAEALPILLEDRADFMGLAATGTGKTAAFTIPLIEKLGNEKGVQALILCPTRELAVQVAGQVTLIGKNKGVKVISIYGGGSYGDQIYGLKNGASVVVGTPGRIVDHIERGNLKLAGVHTLILDEADEMISMGFKEDMETILQSMQGKVRTWLFSATMGNEVRRVADRYLKEPDMVQINRDEVLPDTVEQTYFVTHESNKPEVLCKLIDVAEDFYGIIFCQTKALVQDLNMYLMGRGYRADCLHGDMEQNARDRTMKAFREKKFEILVATDVACRGLDVKDITHVINYSIPRELDNYIHRIGRTGRSGKSGHAFSLVSPSQRGLLHRVERITKRKMIEGKIPTLKETAMKKIKDVLDRFMDQKNYPRAQQLLGDVWKSSLESMSKEEIVARFLSMVHLELFAHEAKPVVVVPAEVENHGGGRRDRGYGGHGGRHGDRNQRGRPEHQKAGKKNWTRFGAKEGGGNRSDRGQGRRFGRKSGGKPNAPVQSH